MTRIEQEEAPQNTSKVQELESEIEKLKRGLKRKQGKKAFGCSSCLVIFLVIVITLVLLLLYFVAKSGVKEIPYFSQRFYQEPVPSHYVAEKEYTEEQKNILLLLKNKIVENTQGKSNADKIEFSLDLPEELLTRIIQDEINKNENLAQKIDYIQLAINKQNIEIFAKNQEPSNIIVTINIEPRLENDYIDLKVVNFKLGDLSLPSFLADASFVTIAEKIFNSVIRTAAEKGKIEAVNLDQGVISLDLIINNFQDFLNDNY